MEPTSLGQPTISPIGFSELLQIKMVHITLARSKVTSGNHTVYHPLPLNMGSVLMPPFSRIHIFACHLGSGTAVQAICRKHSGHTNLLGHSCSGAQGSCCGTAVDCCHRRRAGVRQLLQDLLSSEAWLLVPWRNIKGKGGSTRVSENVANLRVPGKEHPLELGTV